MLTRIHTTVAIRINEMKARNEDGASAVEYGLLVSLIAAAIIVAVIALGSKLSTTFTNVGASIK